MPCSGSRIERLQWKARKLQDPYRRAQMEVDSRSNWQLHSSDTPRLPWPISSLLLYARLSPSRISQEPLYGVRFARKIRGLHTAEVTKQFLWCPSLRYLGIGFIIFTGASRIMRLEVHQSGQHAVTKTLEQPRRVARKSRPISPNDKFAVKPADLPKVFEPRNLHDKN